MRRRSGVKGHSRRQVITIQHILMEKKTKYIHEKCSLFNCSNAITFAVGNINVFLGPLTLSSDGFVEPPLFFNHFSQ